MLGQPQANLSPIHLRSGVVPSLPLSVCPFSAALPWSGLSGVSLLLCVSPTSGLRPVSLLLSLLFL